MVVYSGTVFMKDCEDIKFKDCKVSMFENSVRLVNDRNKTYTTVPFTSMTHILCTPSKEEEQE